MKKMMNPNDFGKKEVFGRIETEYDWKKQVTSYSNVCKFGTLWTSATGTSQFPDSQTSND